MCLSPPIQVCTCACTFSRVLLSLIPLLTHAMPFIAWIGSSRTHTSRNRQLYAITTSMPATLADVLKGIHNSFDVIKSELMTASTSRRGDHLPSVAASVATLSNTEDEASCEPPARRQSVGTTPASVVSMLKAQLLAKEEKVCALRERCETASVELQERDATLASLHAQCVAVNQRVEAMDAELRTTHAQLQEERKQVIMLTERSSRLQHDVQLLSSTEADWNEWVATVEAQAASTSAGLEAARRLNEAQAAELAALSTAKSELCAAQRALTACTEERNALHDEVSSLREGLATFERVFTSSSALCTTWQNEMHGFFASKAMLESRLSEAQNRVAVLEGTVAQLLTRCLDAPIVDNTVLRDRGCFQTIPPQEGVCEGGDTAMMRQAPRRAPSVGSDDGGGIRLCAQCPILESRIIELTLNLAQASEQTESAVLELEAFQMEVTRPIVDEVRREALCVDAILVGERWDELKSILANVLRAAEVDRSCATASSGSCGSGGLTAESLTEGVAPHATLAQWAAHVDALARELRRRDETISQLDAHQKQLQLALQHHQQRPPSSFPESTPRGGVAAPSYNTAYEQRQQTMGNMRDNRLLYGPTTQAAPPTAGPQLHCGVCGWAVAGDNDRTMCRLCGDCYHKTCCRQQEALFVCHKHDAALGQSTTTTRSTSRHPMDLGGGRGGSRKRVNH